MLFMQTPNIDVQRSAMKKLSFLIGRWSGDASVLRGPGEFVELLQTEDAQFKLDGLLLIIEGMGRRKSDGSPLLQALGLISFDDTAGKYHMRAFNDGRWLETEVKLLNEPNSISWGFNLGEISTHSTLRIDEPGEWVERADITIGDRPPQKLIDLRVRRLTQ
jgi:hypothetical protein